MSSPARPPEMCSPWAWSHQPISIPHSTEHWGGSHQQYEQLQSGQIQPLYSIWASYTLVLEVKSHSFCSRISKGRVQDIWNHSFFTLKTAVNSTTPSGTSSKWLKPLLEANLRHAWTPRGDKDDDHLSHILPQTEAELQYSGLRHCLRFELSPQMKPPSKRTYSTAEILGENSKKWVCKQMLVTLASTLMETTWEPQVKSLTLN